MAAKSSIDPQRRFAAQLRQIWLLLIEPNDKVQDPEKRRRVRLLSVLILLFTPSILVMAQWQWLADSFRLCLYVSAVILMIAYVLTRRGNVQIGAFLGTLVMSIMPFVFFLSLGNYSVRNATITLIWTASALFVAYLVSGLRGTVLAVLANMIAIALLPVFFSTVSSDALTYVLFFNMVVACEVLVAAIVREQYKRHLAAQSQALHESEERYRDLFNATIEGIVVHENGIILDANPAFEKITGYNLAELVGSPVMRLFPEEEWEAVRAAQTSTETYRSRGIRKDGTLYWFEARGQFHTYRGRNVRVASVQDVTERRQIEAQTFELALEREKVKVLQRFIGDISHDLRTPLSVMKTSIYLLEKLAHDPARFKQSLETLDAQTDQLQRMIEDLISMSRLDKADTSDYHFSWCNLNVLIEEAVLEQQTMALRKNIQLEFFPGEQLPEVLADQSEFKKMVKYLIVNGISYTPEHGLVTLKTCQDERNVMIEVIDTGAGIAALDLPHIFDRFYRADPSRGAEGGAGLGLTIAKKIAEAHSGSIEAESQLGHGSTFRIRLPRVPSPSAIAGSAHMRT